MSNKVYAGIDLGGTKILAVLLDGQGSLLAKSEIGTNAQEGPEAVMQRMISLIKECLHTSHELVSIGVATAGTLNAEEGIVAYASNLGWSNVPLGKVLSQAFGVPVNLENDANAAAYGEWAVGAGRGTKDCVYITVSTGIGAGIISGGKLIRGRDSSAGELGHITIDWNGAKCLCGNVGCLELYASGTAIGRRAGQLAAELPEEGAPLKAKANGSPINSRHVAEAAKEGDALSIRVLREAGQALGAGMVSIIHATNPELVIIGGGAGSIGAPLLDPMHEAIADRAIGTMASGVKFASPLLGKDAGAIGAALLVNA
ncbi:ROK family protein [Cohnella cholangitidis]|uniref:ROK family protein n=1 Tax=Cohnella cholangitidis TaxID=2598458 RepID=A0A7G5BW68_9BACL|nr:ROK family protein [Cohnella cholangitidis]QMV41202.1 ROK family protein [Cohnella cholangitidis]